MSNEMPGKNTEEIRAPLEHAQGDGILITLQKIKELL
jgi:hypothetical protein